MNIVHCTLR